MSLNTADTIHSVHMPSRFVRIRTVMEYTGLPKSTIYARMKDGSFPKNHFIGSRSVAWVLSDIEAWMSQKSQQSQISKGA